MTNFVVVGAGILGITNAYELLRENPNNKVTIVAQHFPTDFEFKNIYTSPIAGANWESFASIDDKFVQEIDAIGYKKFYELIKDRPESGVTARKNVVYITHERFNKDGKIKNIPWFGIGENAKKYGFRELNKNEFNKDKFVYGYEFDGMVIRTSYYMTFLINECWRLSGDAEGPNARFSLLRGTVKTLKEAFKLHSSGEKADFVINCTGLLSRDLLDISIEERKKMYPVRGVVYVAKNTTGLKKVTVVEIGKEDEALYVMPRREGELIIGGCFQIDNESKFVDEALKDRILGRCMKYLPEFNWENLEIIRQQVGFRPFRKGGYRIERDGKIVHCYGVGGAGFQSSWGCAEKVGKLISNFENRSKL
jgi:D-amino-acid oxidase